MLDFFKFVLIIVASLLYIKVAAWLIIDTYYYEKKQFLMESMKISGQLMNIITELFKKDKGENA